jgi:uridine kinase
MHATDADSTDLPRPAELLGQLRQAPVLRDLEPGELRRFVAALEPVTFKAGEFILREGDLTRDLYFVIEGRVQVMRGQVSLVSLSHGAEFGTLSLLTGRARAATVRAQTFVAAARLGWEDWDDFQAKEPGIALRIVEALFGRVREDLMQMTDNVAALMQGRSVPRSAEVEIHLGAKSLKVRTGTPLRDVLPHDLDGDLVVGGLLSQKPMGLTTPIFAPTAISPLTIKHWEGRQIFTHSVGLLLLEAAHAVDPRLDVRLGPSRGASQVVEVRDATDRDLPTLAALIQSSMERICENGAHFRREHWTVDEATAYFLERGWKSSAKLLRTWRQGTVPLVSCGQVYVISLGIFLPDVADLKGYALAARDGGLELTFGRLDPRWSSTEAPPKDELMATRHRSWLRSMGIESVGGFNELCISGQVTQLIRVAEGFQEKQIGAIADSIAAARDRLRIICIAGPSSSGKTTFIKRLTVQLQIDGVNPIGLSLDDYYVDRDKTVKDEQGEYDFEALEALNLPLLQDQVRRLLAGETVKLARYDFKSGLSHPEGGHELSLKRGDMLMLEGIHGLNPALLGAIPRVGQQFRVFVHPSTTLPFDRLSRLSPTDLRLLRRIVRDRHQRGYGAADSIVRWPSVQAGERKHIFPFQGEADVVFDTALIYEPSVLKVYAERYLLEVPTDHPAFATAFRLRHLIDHFVAIYPDHVPPTSLIREFIGGSGFEY